MPWPSYPLYPLLAAHAGARPVPVEGGPTSRRRWRERTRAAGALQPQRPDRALPAAPSELGSLLGRLPEHVHVLVDEALIHFQDVEDVDAVPAPRRGLPAPAGGPHLLQGLRPVGPARRLRGGLRRLACSTRSPRCSGVNALTQAAVEYALRSGDAEIERRRALVIRERAPAAGGARELARGRRPQPGQLRVAGGRRPERRRAGRAPAPAGVIVAPGGPLGRRRPRARAAIRDAAATERLLRGAGQRAAQ